MSNLIDLGCWDSGGNLRVIVEVPQGSTAKLRYNPLIEAFELQRFISSGAYPYDWGFVPSTLACDGDPLDAMVVHEGHTWPGVIIPCVAVALLKLSETQDGESTSKRNDRLIAVPAPSLAQAPRLALEPDTRTRLEQFFVATGELARKRISIEGWGDAGEAADAVSRASHAYEAKGGAATERNRS